MKRREKIIILIVMVLITMFSLSFVINLLLNKKYVVDEILYASHKSQLEGLHDLITYDYIWMMYFTVFSLIVMMVFGVMLLSKK